MATGNPDFGGDTFGEIVQWLVVIDIAAVGLGTATGTTRGFFALARDRHLPRPLAAVHPKLQDALHRGHGRLRSRRSSSR